MIVAFMLIGHTLGYYLWQISAKSPRLGHALVVLGTLVFGANIGTTMPAQLIAFRVQDYALPILGIGVILYLFFRFASALCKFSFTLNFTILLIRSKGIGLSSGNLTEPFAPA